MSVTCCIVESVQVSPKQIQSCTKILSKKTHLIVAWRPRQEQNLGHPDQIPRESKYRSPPEGSSTWAEPPPPKGSYFLVHGSFVPRTTAALYPERARRNCLRAFESCNLLLELIFKNPLINFGSQPLLGKGASFYYSLSHTQTSCRKRGKMGRRWLLFSLALACSFAHLRGWLEISSDSGGSVSCLPCSKRCGGC